MISVCMATYNGEKYLREQVDSILVQLGKDDELVVSDDDSTDNTLNILNSYNDSRIKVFLNTSNHGVNGNFENALRKSKGDYIFLSDQDDVWLPGKVEKCIDALHNYDCVVHDCYITDSNLIITAESIFKEINASPGLFHNIIKNGYTGCCMAFSRNILKKTLPFPKYKSFYHDQWIGLNAEFHYTCHFIDTRLILFRRHNYNSSSAGSLSQLSFIKKIESRILLCKSILLRIINTSVIF